MTDLSVTLAKLDAKVLDVPDFPKKGIIFKDITPLLADAESFRLAQDLVIEPFQDKGIDFVAGIESRGFIFASAAALRLKAGFVPVRKEGKLPRVSKSVSYELEYGSATLEIHQDAIPAGSKVLLVDDVLATGGTALAAAQLIEHLGAEVAGFSFLLELGFLKGRDRLASYPIIHSILKY